ncbi:hypothetical protein MnBA_39340 [Marinobacterium sp. BA1]
MMGMIKLIRTEFMDTTKLNSSVESVDCSVSAPAHTESTAPAQCDGSDQRRQKLELMRQRDPCPEMRALAEWLCTKNRSY